MLNRAIYKKIESFFETDKKALLIDGARQTGKTFTIRLIGSQCFENIVEINFIKQPDAVQIINNAKGSEDLLLRLSLFAGKKMVPGKTLIFFDEIQECPEIVTAIKFLVEEGSYRYVLSGSLLGVKLNDIRSVPVGYMSIMQMYPLDFREFAEAVGLSSVVMDSIQDSFQKKIPVDSFVHGKLLEIVKLYLMIGGMPAVVQKYVDTNNLHEVLNEQKDIIKLYKKDISKYQKEKKLEIEEVYNLIPAELDSKNKRYKFKDIESNSRYSKYEDAFLWLKDAGVAIPTFNVEEPRSPLLLNKQNNSFKLFLNDVGLLAASYAGDFLKNILTGKLNMNFGAVFENFAAQELYAHGFATDDHNLFYFNSKKQGEVDFVIEKGNAIPIEIKSGKDYERHRALNNILDKEDYEIQQSYVFCQDNLKLSGKITYLPIYMLMCLKKEVEMENPICKLDMTGLSSGN